MGPVSLGPVTFSLHWMLAGLAITIFGHQFFCFGCVAQVLYDYSGEATRRWLSVFRYTRSLIASGIGFAGGIALLAPLVLAYWKAGLRLPPETLLRPSHMAVMGLLVVSKPSIKYANTLLLHAAELYDKPKFSP